MVKHKLLIAIYLLIVSVPIYSKINALVINEVLSNEPGSNRSLEWIELYNPLDSTFNLSGYYLENNGNALTIIDPIVISRGEYLIICRKLIGDLSSDGFESVWGDNPSEASMITPIEIPIELLNSGDTIKLFDSADQLISIFGWSSSGVDGYSWERVNYDSDTILQSEDLTGSSPGRLNSVSKLNQDLGIEEVTIKKNNCISTKFEVLIKSHSIDTVRYATLWIHFPFGDTVAFVGLPSIAPDSSYKFIGELFLFEELTELIISLSSDERFSNNSVARTFPGENFQSLMLNELMVNPPDAVGSEWIELFNNTSSTIDLSSFSIKVGDDKIPLTDLIVQLDTGEYYLLVEDKIQFESYYDLSLNISELANWSALRNSSDTIQLIDQYEIVVDELIYSGIPEPGFTFSRSEAVIDNCLFGYSADYGGTPGTVNSSLFTPTGSQFTLSIEPEIISRSDIGVDNEFTIELVAPNATDYSLEIYDRHGRLIKSFYDSQPLFSEFVNWDGKSDNGLLLPVGIYIVLAQANNYGSVKKTVVIAP